MRSVLALLAGAVLSICLPARAQDTKATLTLDGLSFISVEGHAVFAIPSGSTIEFQFGKPGPDSIPFSIDPVGVKISPIEADAKGAELRYSLAGGTSGTLRRAFDGSLEIDLAGSILASWIGAEGASSANFPVQFTTGKASLGDDQAIAKTEIEGLRISPGSTYVQLVTVALNHPDSIVGGGAPVKSVLSGSFDKLPELAPAAAGP